jgi:hypothetical protein
MFFSDIGGFGDGGLDISAFCNTDTNLVLVVTDNNERLKPKAASALNNAGNTIDINYQFLILFRFSWSISTTALSLAA